MRFGVGLISTDPVPRMVAKVKLAEDLGYDTAWLIDSPLVAREVYVTMTACALATSRIGLGTGVAVPYLRHASVTAGTFATLNDIAEGRLKFGIGTGNSAMRTLGLAPVKIRDMESYITTVQRLLATERTRFEGGTDGRITFLSEAPAVPVYVACTGPRAHAAAGRVGDGVITLCGTSDTLVGRAIAKIEEGARQAGRTGDKIDVHLWCHTSIAPERELARQHVRGRVAGFIRMSKLENFDEADREEAQRVKTAYDYYEHTKADARHRAIVPDKFVDNIALAGTPEEVREQVQRLMSFSAVDQIVIGPQVSGEAFVSDEYILRTFAENVISYVS